MTQARARVDGQGRVVIPAAYRRALGLREGDAVVLELEDETVRIRTLSDAIRRAQAIVAARNPGRRSLVDELIEERRAEERHEGA